jgi:hypothetical protein
MTSGNAEYHLTPLQVREVKSIQRNLHTGKTRVATKREKDPHYTLEARRHIAEIYRRDCVVLDLEVSGMDLL